MDFICKFKTFSANIELKNWTIILAFKKSLESLLLTLWGDGNIAKCESQVTPNTLFLSKYSKK